MSDQFLTISDFSRWAEHFDHKLDRVLEARVDVEGRLTSLETNQARAGSIAAWLSSIVAAIVTAGMLALAKFRGE